MSDEVQKEIKEAIAYYEDLLVFGRDNKFAKAKKRYSLVLQALRQMQTEPCEWCNGGYFKATWNLLHITKDVECNYCPNCGRKLKGEST